MAVRIVVTAENGDTAEYVLVMSKAETQSAGEALLAQIQAEDIAKADQAAAEAVMEKSMPSALSTWTARKPLRPTALLTMP